MRVCDWVFKRGVGGLGSRVRVCVECGELILQTSESVGKMWKEYEKSVQLKNNLYAYKVDKEKTIIRTRKRETRGYDATTATRYAPRFPVSSVQSILLLPPPFLIKKNKSLVLGFFTIFFLKKYFVKIVFFYFF